MTDNETQSAERMLREAGQNPVPSLTFRMYRGRWASGGTWEAQAIFVNGRLLTYYRPDPDNEGLYQVLVGPEVTYHSEIVEGEATARDLCRQWAEEHLTRSAR